MREWVHDWWANYPDGDQTNLRVRHRACYGLYAVVVGTAAARACVLPSVVAAGPSSRNDRPWLPCRFPRIQPDTANPEPELLRDPQPNSLPRPALRRTPASRPTHVHTGRKYHRSDRGYGNGGYEQHGYLFAHLHRTGRRRQHRHHHPHGHGGGQPHRGSECHRSDGYDLVSARHFYHG